jgi:hypothetical protein
MFTMDTVFVCVCVRVVCCSICDWKNWFANGAFGTWAQRENVCWTHCMNCTCMCAKSARTHAHIASAHEQLNAVCVLYWMRTNVRIGLLHVRRHATHRAFTGRLR